LEDDLWSILCTPPQSDKCCLTIAEDFDSKLSPQAEKCAVKHLDKMSDIPKQSKQAHSTTTPALKSSSSLELAKKSKKSVRFASAWQGGLEQTKMICVEDTLFEDCSNSMGRLMFKCISSLI
jgi:hypothetical protein